MSEPTNYSRAKELVADLNRDDGSVDFGDGGEAFAAVALVHAVLAVADQLRALTELLTPAPRSAETSLAAYKATLANLKHSKETS